MQPHSRVQTCSINNSRRFVFIISLCASEEAMKFQIFNYIELLDSSLLVVCKQCQHAVWLKKVIRHFCGAEHDLLKKIIRQITTTVQKHKELYQYLTQLESPIAIECSFKSLQLCYDELLCQFQPGHCHYVCISEKSMQEHAWQAHYALQYRQKEWPTKCQQEWQETADSSVLWVSVACQRFFPLCQGSQYFQMQQPDEVQPQTADCIVSVWDQAVKAMKERVKKVEAEHQKMIVKRTDWEVNQWLEWAEWDKYLVNIEVNKLLDCVAVLNEETEQELWMIWQAMNCII